MLTRLIKIRPQEGEGKYVITKSLFSIMTTLFVMIWQQLLDPYLCAYTESFYIHKRHGDSKNCGHTHYCGLFKETISSWYPYTHSLY